MDKAGIAPGMTVADIGAGQGYYTVRLANRVGAEGRVLAEDIVPQVRSEEHTSELQSLMRISYAVFCLKKKNNTQKDTKINHHLTAKTTCTNIASSNTHLEY